MASLKSIRGTESRGLVIGGVGVCGEGPVRVRGGLVQEAVSAAAAAPRRRVRPNKRDVRIPLRIPRPSVVSSPETVPVRVGYPKTFAGSGGGSGGGNRQRRAFVIKSL